MKSTFTKIMIAAILAIVSSLAMEARFQVTLASGGQLTSFKYFEDAMKQANPMDTIYLVSDVQRSITINKPIVLIGDANPSNLISLEIDLNDSDVERAKVSIEGFVLYHKYNYNYDYRNWVVSNVGTLEFKNCNMSSEGWTDCRNVIFTKDSAKIGRILIDRCNFDELKGGEVGSIFIRNSILNVIEGSTINENEFLAVNSYIGYANGSCSYFNCLAGGTYKEGGDFQHSYVTDIAWDNVQALINAGFLGDDGTVAGPMGGAEPHYSLMPDVPIVDFEKSNVEYDKASKKLKIKVKVLKE